MLVYLNNNSNLYVWNLTTWVCSRLDHVSRLHEFSYNLFRQMHFENEGSIEN
jgi:hypothetical protein